MSESDIYIELFTFRLLRHDRTLRGWLGIKYQNRCICPLHRRLFALVFPSVIVGHFYIFLSFGFIQYYHGYRPLRSQFVQCYQSKHSTDIMWIILNYIFTNSCCINLVPGYELFPAAKCLSPFRLDNLSFPNEREQPYYGATQLLFFLCAVFFVFPQCTELWHGEQDL